MVDGTRLGLLASHGGPAQDPLVNRSEVGAARRAYVRPDVATVTAYSLVTCPDACYQAPRSRVRSVVVLDVVGPNPFAHPGISAGQVTLAVRCDGLFGVSDVRF
jgi:hypothetical protein